jgi:hypothetical protein
LMSRSRTTALASSWSPVPPAASCSKRADRERLASSPPQERRTTSSRSTTSLTVSEPAGCYASRSMRPPAADRRLHRGPDRTGGSAIRSGYAHRHFHVRQRRLPRRVRRIATAGRQVHDHRGICHLRRRLELRRHIAAVDGGSDPVQRQVQGRHVCDDDLYLRLWAFRVLGGLLRAHGALAWRQIATSETPSETRGEPGRARPSQPASSTAGIGTAAGKGRRGTWQTVTTSGATTKRILALREHLIAKQVTLAVMERPVTTGSRSATCSRTPDVR